MSEDVGREVEPFDDELLAELLGTDHLPQNPSPSRALPPISIPSDSAASTGPTFGELLLIALMGLIAAAVSVGVTAAMWETTWDASSLVRVGRPGAFADQFTDPAYVERVLRSVAELGTDSSVTEATWVAAGLDPMDPPNTLSIEVVRETELLRLHVLDTDPERAQATLAEFTEQVGSAVEQVYGDGLEFIPAGATPDLSEAQPPFLVRGALGAAAGILVGIGAVALVRRRRA